MDKIETDIQAIIVAISDLGPDIDRLPADDRDHLRDCLQTALDALETALQ